MARAGISDTVLVLAVLCLAVIPAPAPAADAPGTTMAASQGPDYRIRLFIPAPESIHSDQIKDAANGIAGNVLFATSFGLSEYNGSWSTRHVTRDNTSEGLLDDYITAIEFDPAGNLWIGYSGGFQVFNGATYTTVRDQQLLKDPRVNALQRWGDSMWIATGNAGIHRYTNGTWTWFQPMSKGGPGFYEVEGMAVDPRSDILLVSTEKDGIWTVNSSRDPVGFERIDTVTEVPVPVRYVRQDPFGGAYFFDRETVTWYSPASGWNPVLTAKDLAEKPVVINDIAAVQDGSLAIGTDDGIYFWEDGKVKRYLGRFEGIGTSRNVRRVFADVTGRVWFATQGHVGVITTGDSTMPQITIQVLGEVPSKIPPPLSTPLPPPAASGTTPGPATTLAGGNPEPSLLERLIAVFLDFFEKFTGGQGGAG